MAQLGGRLSNQQRLDFLKVETSIPTTRGSGERSIHQGVRGGLVAVVGGSGGRDVKGRDVDVGAARDGTEDFAVVVVRGHRAVVVLGASPLGLPAAGLGVAELLDRDLTAAGVKEPAAVGAFAAGGLRERALADGGVEG